MALLSILFAFVTGASVLALFLWLAMSVLKFIADKYDGY